MLSASAFALSVNGQEPPSSGAVIGETAVNFIDRNIDFADRKSAADRPIDDLLTQGSPRETQVPDFNFHILSDERRKAILRFSDPPVGDSEIDISSADPFRPLKLALSGNQSNRSFERFLYAADLSANDENNVTQTDVDDPLPTPQGENRLNWRPAIYQSLLFLGIQHGFSLTTQEKTRRALANGNFFTDYWRSLKGLRGWDDGNRFFTNYVAHPMQGGLTGFIFVQNHDRAKKQKFGESKEYWNDRFKAFIWSAAWSTQFELGPISQSSIGNLGLYGGMGYVDLVITPTVGTGWLMIEEAIDRYLIRHIETQSFVLKMFVRVLLNPMRGVANALRFKHPWYRDRPFGH